MHVRLVALQNVGSVVIKSTETVYDLIIGIDHATGRLYVGAFGRPPWY